MWDTTVNLPNEINVFSNTNKHEHRAPTDESVRLLREMELAAFNSVLDRINISSNYLNATVVRIEHTPHKLSQQFILLFTLNDVKYEELVEIPNYKLRKQYDVRELMTIVVDEISKRIAAKLLEHMDKENINHLLQMEKTNGREL